MDTLRKFKDKMDREKVIELHRQVLHLIEDGHDRLCASGMVIENDQCFCERKGLDKR